MTLRPDIAHPKAGMTLFETLVALAILSLMAAVVVAARPQPSASLQLKSQASELYEQASQVRQDTVASGRDTIWKPDAVDCEEEPVSLVFYADGTSEEGEICLAEGGEILKLRLAPLSARLVEVSQ